MARLIDFATAINEIKSAYEDRSSNRSPFFLIVGAGISYPSIPLASDITIHCRQKAQSRGIKIEVSGEDSALSEYSFWFDRAYPQPIDRQRYLRSLIEKKPISDANLRLAHILLSHKITNLVITPNFDDLLSRSLNIFGEPHVVSDHPRTVDRIDLEGNDIQIVHVHGSYRFYDCRNLRDELESRARPSPTTTNTIAAFLDRVLSFRSPLVVGYAGWESDVIMAALKRRLEGNTLPYRLYWCCYTETSAQELPSWLRKHGDVRMVVPSSSVISLESKNISAKKEISEAERGRSKLTARMVFEELSRAFELEQPALTSDPVGFFSKQLRHAISSEVGNKDGVYFFGDIISRVERAAELLREEEQSPKKRKSASPEFAIGIPAALAGLKDSVRRSRYDEALEFAVALNPPKLSKPNLSEWFDIVIASLRRGSRDLKKRLEAVNMLITAGRKLLQVDDAQSFRKYIVTPLMIKADILKRLGRVPQAITVYDQVIEKTKDAKQAELQFEHLYSQSRKVLALNSLKKTAEALALYDKMLPNLQDSSKTDTEWLLAQSLFNRSQYLASLGRLADAIVAVDQFLQQFENAKDGWTQVLVAAALRHKAGLLLRLGNNNKNAIACMRRVVELYSGVEHPQVKQEVELARKLQEELGKKTQETEKGIDIATE